MTDVCRLCSRARDLVCVLDNRIDGRWEMRTIVLITTGVEINISDQVTQKICKACYKTATQMFKFRVAASNNNKRLLFKKDSNNKEQNFKEQKKNIYENEQSSIANHIDELEGCIYEEKKFEGMQSEKSPKFKYTSRHYSINELKKCYPKLQIPKKLLNCNISPKVQLNKDDVDAWFRERRDLDVVSEASEESEVSEVPEIQNAIITSSKDETVLPSSVVEQAVLEKDDVIVTNDIQVSITTEVQRIAPQEIDPVEDSNSSTSPFNNVCKKRKIRKLTDSSEESSASKKIRSETSDEEKGDDLSSDDVLFVSRTVEDPKVELSYFKSTNVEICKICNDVIYNAREMKKHTRKHSRCQFCKTRYRTLEAKDKHIESCLYRKAMQSDAVISLVRVDEDETVMKKYPNVFLNDSATDSDDNDDDVIVVTTSDDEKNRSGDQTNNLAQTSSAEKNNVPDATVVNAMMEKTNTPVATVVNTMTEKKNIPDATVVNAVTEKNDIPNATVVNVMPNSMNLGHISPNLRISTNSIYGTLNFTANEIQTIKTLLRHIDGANKLPIPSNNSIVNQGTPDKMFSLKNIMPYLRAYTIPIDLQYNSKLTVSYNAQVNSGEATAKKQIWNPSLYLKPVKEPSSILQQTTANKSITDNIKNFRKNQQVQHTTSISKPHNIPSSPNVGSTSSNTKQLSAMLEDVSANQEGQKMQKAPDQTIKLQQLLLEQQVREIMQNKPRRDPPPYSSIRSNGNNGTTAMGNGTKNSNSAVTSGYNSSNNPNCQRTVARSVNIATYSPTAVPNSTKNSNAVDHSATKNSNSLLVATRDTANRTYQQQQVVVRNIAPKNFQNSNNMSRGINNPKSAATAMHSPAVCNNSTRNVNSPVNVVSNISRNVNATTTSVSPNNHYQYHQTQPRNLGNHVKSSNSTVNSVSNINRHPSSTMAVTPNNYQQPFRNEQPRNFERPAIMGGQRVIDLTKNQGQYYGIAPQSQPSTQCTQRPTILNYQQNNTINNLYVVNPPVQQQPTTVYYPQYEIGSQFLPRM